MKNNNNSQSISVITDILLSHYNNNANKNIFIINDEKIELEKFYSDIIQCQNILIDASINQYDRVAIVSSNSYHSIVAFWAVVSLGGVVSIIDALQSKEKLHKVIENLSPSIILCNESDTCFNNKASIISQDVLTNAFNQYLNDESFPQGFTNLRKRVCKNNIIPTDIAMIIYTSGSTGDPKGVVMTHNNVISALSSINDYLDISQNDVIFSALKIYFDYGLYQMLLSVSMKACLVLWDNMPHPAHFYHILNRYNVTILPLVPGMISLLSKYSQKYSVLNNTIKKITNTGERLSLGHIEFLQENFSNAQVFSMYGLTECKRCTFLDPKKIRKKPSSIGKPMRNITIEIIKNGRIITECNEIGEVVISGPSVMQCYWQNQKATRERLKRDNLGCTRLFTGDLGYFDIDGDYYLVGRQDNTIKINGVKCNLAEYIRKIEALDFVLRAHVFAFDTLKIGQSLIVAVESISNVKTIPNTAIVIKSVFSKHHQPVYIFYSLKFPELSNGKVNTADLEKVAITAYLDR